MYHIFLVLISFLVITNLVFAQKESDNILTDGWKLTGLGHMTSQLDAKDFNEATDPISYTFLKIRLGVEKSLGEDILFKVDIRDSRLWGFEGNPVADKHNLDLQEGYLEFRNIFNIPLSVQAGRFIMIYGNGRFIGNSFWRMNERAFDGIRIKYQTEKFKADIFSTNVRNGSDYILSITPGIYSETSGNLDNSFGLYGMWFNFTSLKDNSFDVFTIYENDRNETIEGTVDLERITLGVNHDANFGMLASHLEAALQTGSHNGTDILAYLIAANFKVKIRPLLITAGWEMYSGSAPKVADNTYEIGTIDVTNGSKHKFLGAMDYFLAVGPGTNNLGVNDAYLTFQLGDKESKWIPSLTYHYFLSNQEGISGLTDFGQEIDLQLAYTITKGAKLVGGVSTFIQGDLMKEIWKNEDTPYWAFLMTVVNL